MLEDKRETGEIVIDGRLRALLAALRAVEGSDAPPELDVEEVRDVERGLGRRLPPSVLALFAAKVHALEMERETSLPRVIGLTGKVRSLGAPGDLVAIGRERDGRFVCLEKGGADEGETRLTFFDPEPKSLSRVSLVGWLEGILEEMGAGGDELERFEASFAPRLARRLPGGSPGMQVVHETFGEGRVLREMGSGPKRKVQVDFPGKGLKLIQARFLRWLE